MNLHEILNWRYATKRMNGQKVPADKLERILDATRMAASSFGLQPYTVIVIENPELRSKIQPLAYNQPQIAEASHLLVFAAWSAVSEERVSDFINQVATERGIPAENLAVYKSTILGSMNGKPADAVLNWTGRQAYIALGTALIAAANEGVDSTPMEGFNPDALDELLGLKEMQLHSLAILALGYRHADADPIVKAKKVRRDKEKLFLRLS